MPDAGLDASVCTLVEALCGLYHTHTQVVGGGEGEHRSGTGAGSGRGGNWVHTRTVLQLATLEGAFPKAGWDHSPQSSSPSGKPREICGARMSGSTGGADHTMQTWVSETWGIPVPLFLTILLQN